MCIIVLIFILCFSFYVQYFKRNKDYYVKYDESSNIDYKVYLKENEFFNNTYLESNKQYIASLIDYIDADFKYDLSLDEMDVQYKYLYKIEAEVVVKEKKSSNFLYNKKEELLENQERVSSLKNVSIKESINIDYNYYNNLVKKFLGIYNLDDTESFLNINMYVNVIGSCEKFDNNHNQESVMSLVIPLTTKTMAIDISNNLINSENMVMLCKSVYTNNYVFLVFGLLFTIIDLGLIGYTINYEIKTRTAENIYEKEMKKILNNYGSYIQKIGNDFKFQNYQLVKVDSFSDMLEIRDTIRQPILLKENKEKTGAYFVIPSNTKLMYVYRLKVSDIKKGIIEIKNKQVEEEPEII